MMVSKLTIQIVGILITLAGIFAGGFFFGYQTGYANGYDQGNASGYGLAKTQYGASSFDLGFNEGLKFNSTYDLYSTGPYDYTICNKGEPEYVIYNSTITKTIYATGTINKSESTITYVEYNSLSPNCSLSFNIRGGNPKPDLAEFYRQWRGF